MNKDLIPASYFDALEPYKNEDITIELERDLGHGERRHIPRREFERRVSYWKPKSLIIDHEYWRCLQNKGFVYNIELGYYMDESYMPDRLKGMCAPILITVITRFHDR